MLSTKHSRRAAAVGGLISLLVGAGFVCVYFPGNLTSAVNASADQHPGLRGARSVASDFVVVPDSKFKGTWLDPSSDESTHNLGAWSNTLVEPTTTEAKQASAADLDFQQWKRERRDVAVVRRIEDSRRQAPGPAASDVFTPIPPPPNPVPTPTPLPPTTPDVTTTVQQLRQTIKEQLVSECLSPGTYTTALDTAKCVFTTLRSALNTLDEAGILAQIAASNPAVAAAVKDVIDNLKNAEEDCADQEDTADGYKTCIRKKITDLEKETKDKKQTEKNALVKLFKQFYADVNICAAKKDKDAVKTCTDKRTDKFLNKLEDFVKKALPTN